MTELRPGTSPPPVRMPMRFMAAAAMLPDRRAICEKTRFLAELTSANGVPPCVLDPHSPASLCDLAAARSPFLEGSSRRRAGLDHLRTRTAPRHRPAEGADPRVGDVPGLRRTGLTFSRWILHRPPMTSAAGPLLGRSPFRPTR